LAAQFSSNRSECEKHGLELVFWYVTVPPKRVARDHVGLVERQRRRFVRLLRGAESAEVISNGA